MEIAKFYSANGPYLHHDPKYAPEAPDYFVLQSINHVKQDINKNYEIATQEIRQKAQKAEIFEKGFYHQFGVKTAQEFSKKYLVDLRTELMDKQSIKKIFKSGTLAQRILYIINQSDIYDTILSQSVQDIQPTIASIFGDQIAKEIFDSAQSQGDIGKSVTRVITQLVTRAISNVHGKQYTKAFGKPYTTVNRPSSQSLGRTDLGKQIEQVIKNNGGKNRDQTYKEVLQLINKELGKNFEKASASALEKIKAQLYDPKLIPPALFKDEEQRSSILGNVVEKVSDYLYEQMSHKGGLMYRNYLSAAGGLYSIGMEVALEAQIRSKDLQLIVESIGDRTQKRIDSNALQELPSDFRMDKFLIQLKSQRGTGLNDLKGIAHLRSQQFFSTTFSNLLNTNIMSSQDIDKFKYLLVNNFQREKPEYLLETLEYIISWGVELYVRSDTVSSLLEKVSDLPIGGATADSPFNATVAQNHFWIVNNTLIPVSTFLNSVAGLLDEHKNITKWYKIEGDITGKRYDDEKLYNSKLAAKTGDKWYSDDVIGAGIAAGNDVYNHIQIPAISLSNSFVDKVRQL